MLTDTASDNPITPPLRRSRRPAPQARLPIVFQPRVLAIAAGLAAALWLGLMGYDAWRNSFAQLQVRGPDGEKLAGVHVEFFSNDQSSTGTSPPKRIGEYHAESADVTVGTDLVPGNALIRVKASGFGATYGLMEAGQPALPVKLGKPLSRRGRVVAGTNSGSVPIEGASVQAFGGGARGVLLEEVLTDADGVFTLTEISDTVPFLTYRVFARGYGLYEKEEHGSIDQLDSFSLAPTRPVVGRVIAPEGYDPTGLELRIFRLPGAIAKVGEDGSFRFDNLPPSPMRCTIVAPTLPKNLTFRKCVVRAGDDDVELSVHRAGRLRGFAIDRESRKAIAGTKVFHEHGPNGIQVVTCDRHGQFELARVPQGSVRITADVLVRVLELDNGRPKRVRRVRQGSVDVETNEAEVIDEIVVPID